MTCQTKHTTYQPTDAEWKCPDCGADVGVFYIDESPAGTDPMCSKVHTKDLVRCDGCGMSWTGTGIAKILNKKTTSVPCVHCKGTGRVEKETK